MFLPETARRLLGLLCLAALLPAAGCGESRLRYPTADRCRMDRAGHPNRVAPYAKCTYDEHYGGYYVGGGGKPVDARVHPGECRYTQEGTFGMDYAPPWSKVALGWKHDREERGDDGQYQAEGHVNPFTPGGEPRE